MLFAPATVSCPRSPQFSDSYRCVEDHFETFFQVYEERPERLFGFWRPYLQKVIYRYLESGDLRHGFAWMKCRDCHHEYFLALSCKGRHFWPSCHQKRGKDSANDSHLLMYTQTLQKKIEDITPTHPSPLGRLCRNWVKG